MCQVKTGMNITNFENSFSLCVNLLYNICMDENTGIYSEIASRTVGARTQQEAAAMLGVSETLYSLLMSRKRDVSKELAARLGYSVRVVKVYERIPAPVDGPADADGVAKCNECDEFFSESDLAIHMIESH